MNIFSAKYKAHRLVNYIFYIIVFFFGFLVGIGAKNIDLNKFLPKILMIENVNAGYLDGWGAFGDIYEFQNASFGRCSSSSCGNWVAYESIFQLNSNDVSKFTTIYSTRGINTSGYGDMLLSFQRYITGYLYSYTVYVCSSPDSTTLQNSGVELHVGNFSQTTGMQGGLTYSNVLVNTISNYPFSSSATPFGSCYAITQLFVPYRDGQNLGLVLKGSTSSNNYWYAIGYNYKEIGIYTDTIGDVMSGVVSSSGLATASSVQQVQNSLQRVEQQVDELNNAQQETNDLIKDDNISGASSEASDFFSDFTTDTHGLTGIITAPLNLISSITSTTCSSLVLPVPFVNTNLTLPCLSSIYSQFFGSFLTIYQSITFGIVAYWVCVRIFNLVKDFKNPDHDEIEVLDL